MNESWEIKKLGELGTLTSSKRIFKKEYVSDGIPFYRSKEIKELAHNRNISLALFITKERFEEIEIQFGIPKKGDILLTAVGTIGEMYVVKDNDKFYFKDGNIMWLKNFNSLNTYYLKYALTAFVDQIKALSQGSAYNALTIEKLKTYEIPVPPIPEQKRIVDILDEAFVAIDKAKENAEKNLRNSRELFDSYLNKVFANPGEDWEEKTLGDVCEMVNRGISPKYIDEGLCVLNQKCIRDHRINFELSRCHDRQIKKVNNDKFIQIGDVLVNSTGVGTLGRVAQARELPVEAIVDSHITIVRPKKNMFYNDFFGYALIVIEKEIAKKGEGCGGQTELARNTLKNDFKICYPKAQTEQQSIVAQFDNFSSQTKKLIAIYQQKLTDLEELKRTILQKAFNGELTMDNYQLEHKVKLSLGKSST